MLIKDAKGLYELKVDKKRRLVYETAKGNFSAEDYTRMTDEYPNKIIPYLGKGKWAKFCDVRATKPNVSNTAEHINKELSRLIPSGFFGGSMLVSSVTLKMQVNRASKGMIQVKYFDDASEADEWLKENGF